MFESFLEKILNRVIGQYVEGIQKEDMKVGLLSGNVEIKNLKLKKQILEELKLPFSLKFGKIDRLKLQVPWKNLSGSAVIANLEGLYLLITPTDKSIHN
jgi:vacuolar protein sorting-associated protein 13A/C